MTARYGLAVLVLGACNSVLGLEPGTLADPVPPSCAAGWSRRIPIFIDNTTNMVLTGYQIDVPLELGARADLRFGIDSRTPPLAYELNETRAIASVLVPELVPGTTRIYAFYDNPDADSWSGPSPFQSDVIANPSFESTGAWTIGTGGARFEFSTEWASDGEHSLAIDAYRSDRVFRNLDYGVSQRARFPLGSDYVLRFDLAVVAASNSGANSSGEFFVSVGDGLVTVWRKSGDEGNITGIYRDIETRPFGPGDVGIMLGVTLRDGTSSSYAKGFYDNVRVRKHVTPEPTVVVGVAEDACGT